MLREATPLGWSNASRIYAVVHLHLAMLRGSKLAVFNHTSIFYVTYHKLSKNQSTFARQLYIHTFLVGMWALCLPNLYFYFIICWSLNKHYKQNEIDYSETLTTIKICTFKMIRIMCNHIMRGKTRVVAVLENRPGWYDGLHDDLVYRVPQAVQVDALRQQDFVQGRYLADGQTVY